jgi:hypothetical protein
VCYLEEKPELDEGPFLKEAKDLINAVAESIAKIIDREEAEAAIRKHQDHIEALIEKQQQKYFWKKLTNSGLLELLVLVAERRSPAKKGDPHKISYESPLTAISFISFFEKKFKPIGACSGYIPARAFYPNPLFQ